MMVTMAPARICGPILVGAAVDRWDYSPALLACVLCAFASLFATPERPAAGFAPDGTLVALLADKGSYAKPVLVFAPSTRIWVGAGALGRNSGRVALYFRDDAEMVGPPPNSTGRCA